MSKPLKVLIVEDVETDALLLLRELKRGGYEPTWERVQTAQSMGAALDREKWELCICDYKLPRFSAPAALELLNTTGLDLPVVVVSGTVGEEVAVEVMKAGAHDFILKNNLSRLNAAIDRELREAEIRIERRHLEVQLLQAQKLESIGQLAAGIAHELNTPAQYVGDNTRFLEDAFESLAGILEKYQELMTTVEMGAVTPQILTKLDEALEEADTAFLLKEIPLAIEQSMEGIERVSKLVRAMKEFSHPGAEDMDNNDINRAIETTVTVCRNEWKYVAEMETDLDDGLPMIPCVLGEINQVVLNIIVNAAHAIGENNKKKETTDKGTITISTRKNGAHGEIRIQDSGPGIPEQIQPRIFDPFFTTKELGRGTGQGLAISHSTIVQKHGGEIFFETEKGRGTTFVIRLPFEGGQ